MRSRPAVMRSAGLLFLAAALSSPVATPARSEPATIEPPHLPAGGRATATLTVLEPGRYAITATSGTGTALQVVDRLTGPGEPSGSAGERDGRLDLLLDRGAYRLVTRGAEQAGGEVRLAALPFRAADTAQPALLVEEKPVATELGDFEQRSWWLRVDARRRVILEAAGRNLSDLRLFRDGGWLVDAAPAAETIEPDPGRPLRSLRIVATLAPGLYLLRAFGGPDEPWPAGGDRHPLHLRFGIPTLGEAGRTRYRVGPFGADHYILPGAVTFVRLELAEAAEAALAEAPFPAEGDPFLKPRTSAGITKKHREPVATLEPGAQGGPRLVTVRAAAGQAYVLQHFELRQSYSFQRSGRHWIGSVHSGHAQDSADATAILTGTSAPSRRGLEPLLWQTVEIGAARGWARRCNLPDTLTVFFRVGDADRYEVLLRGSAARARFEPFLVTRPQNYREPELKPSGTAWELGTGWHVLTIVPDQPGIVEAAVRPAGRLDAVWDLLDPGHPPGGEPVRPAATFPAVDLDWGNRYTVYLNRRPGVRSGLVLRQLPIDLERPLPLALMPGEEISVEARVAEAGSIRAETEAGESLEVRAGAGPWRKALDVGAGTFAVRVRNPGGASVPAALRFDALRLREDAPLPALPPGALPPPPQFPALAGGEPRFFDLERGGTATFTVRVAEPAFQTLESTGLLAVAGTLRSRLAPALAAAAGGGTGRNFLIGSYLTAGDYQLTVKALGASRGHLGVRLRRSPLRDGGDLREGTPSRVTVGAAEGVVHPFEIVEAGAYRLEASAAGRPLPGRLEDADGWPLATPGSPARFERRFEPGRYRLLLPPEAVGSRRVTLLERVADPPRLEGHGPHPLELDRTIGHLWVEPPADAGDAARTPDRWEFALPAPATLKVTLTGEMQSEIRRREDPPGAGPLARVPAGRTWSGRLPAGRYALEAVCSRRNNHNRYEITVEAGELLAGASRTVSAPVTLPVSVAAGGLFEFSTSGSADVRARLVSGAGATIAEQEDRPDDWNVQFAARLAPGDYRLELAPTGSDGAPTRVAMRAIAEREEPPLPLPGSRAVLPGEDVAIIPLAIPAGAALLVVRVGADETVGAAVEHHDGGGWQELWSGLERTHAVELPLPGALGSGETARYRLRLWSLDRPGGAIRVAAAAVTPPRINEGELLRGAAVAGLAVQDPPLAVAEIALDRPGLVALGEAPAWRSSGAAHRALSTPGPGDVLAAPGARLWVAVDLPPGAGQATLAGRRVALTPQTPLTVELPADGSPVACDLEADPAGPVLVTASADSGRPAVIIVPRDRPGRQEATAHATAVVSERAAAALSDGTGPVSALLWSADPARPAPRATLRLFGFAAAAGAQLPAGTSGGSIEPGGAQRFSLPRGDKRLRLSLGPGLAAALLRDGRAESAHAAGDAARVETLETAADRLSIVNAAGSPAPWSAELLPLESRDRIAAISAASPHIRDHAAAGTARIAVAPDDGRGAPLRLRVAGAAAAPVFLGADGRILAGDDLAVGGGGALLLPHGRGLTAAWVERPGSTTSGLWGDVTPPREQPLGAAGVVRLGGPSAGFSLKVDAPSVLHLRTERPLVGVLRRPAGGTDGLIQQRAATLELYLAPGTTTLWLRPAAGGDLHGSAEVLLSAVTPIGEGPGPEALLAPGAAHYFSFSVTREGPLGIGVRAAPDSATCRLLDAAGRIIGEGVVQMPRLAPGSYLLAVSAPADGGPVAVRPALAGLVLPGSGPPEDVVRRYLGLAGGGDGNAAAQEHGTASSPHAP